MEEGHEMPCGPYPRLPIDQLVAIGGELCEGRGEIGDLVAQVMHPGAAAFDEACDRGVGTGGGDQFDAARALTDEDQDEEAAG